MKESLWRIVTGEEAEPLNQSVMIVREQNLLRKGIGHWPLLFCRSIRRCYTLLVTL